MSVRLDADHMAVTIETYRLHTWQQIRVVERRALTARIPFPCELRMDEQRWPPGACVLFAVITSLALWTVLILVPFLTFD